jgi:hypothetical protein
MAQLSFTAFIQNALHSVNRYELLQTRSQRLITQKKTNPVFDPEQFENLLIRHCVFSSLIELRAVVIAQQAGIPADLFIHEADRKRDARKQPLVQRLITEYGMNKDIAKWAVEKWAAALGWTLEDGYRKIDIPDFPQPQREPSYYTELVSDADFPSVFLEKAGKIVMPPVLLGREYVSHQLWRTVFPTHMVQSGWLDSPVQSTDFEKSADFCNLLSFRDGFIPCYEWQGNKCICDKNANGWRLPTGAESRFLYYAWGRDENYITLARKAPAMHTQQQEAASGCEQISSSENGSSS